MSGKPRAWGLMPPFERAITKGVVLLSIALAVPIVTGRVVRVRHGRDRVYCADRSTDEARFRRVQ